MANSALSYISYDENGQPIWNGGNNPSNFSDWWYVYDPAQWTAYNGSPDSLKAKIGNFFSGKITSAKNAYANYVSGWEAQYNQYLAEKANYETQHREDTEVQRKVEDYKEAGINPYAMLAGGSGQLVAGSSSQAQMSSYKRSRKSEHDDEKESKLAASAMRVLALILLRKMM